MTDTTAKIRAKGLNATGVTEDIATRLADAGAGHLIAVVELKVEEVHTKADGDRRVDLIITNLEPATEQIAEDHLREFQRALYMNRALDDAQPTLDGDGGPEPTVKDVLARGDALFEKDDDGTVTGLWDGNTDPDLTYAEPADEPHAYVDTAHATCGHQGCGRPAGATIHDVDDLEPQPA